MTNAHSFIDVMRRQQRVQIWRLLGAVAAGSAASVSSVLLLGLSGWFIAAAAVAGLGGATAASAFNYLLPSAGIRLFAIVRTGARYAERLLGHSAAFKAMASFRTHVFRVLATGRPESTLGFSTGEASSRLVQDVDAIENQFVGLSAGPSAILSIIVGLCLILLVGIWPACVLGLGVFVQTFGGRSLYRRLTEASSAQIQTSVGRLKDRYNSLVDAAPELACYGFTDRAVELVIERDADLARAKSDAARGVGAVAALQAICMALTSVGVLVVAGNVPAAMAAMGALVAAATLDSAAALLRASERKGAYRAAVKRLSAIETIREEPGVTEVLQEPPEISLTMGGQPVRISRGERIAVCGASGSGKTRLLEELLRLRSTNPHELSIGGVRLDQLSEEAVRRQFSYLPQNTLVLSGSIKENLLLANPGATDKALWQALDAAELKDRVQAMPDGLLTWVGHAGARLSGGEKRRLCLARALIRTAPWLVLDEPTEGLDAATEQRVVQNIERHLARTGQGLILVSHRTLPLTLCSYRMELSE